MARRSAQSRKGTPRTVKSAEDRQREILAAAKALFAQRGYANTSVQSIIDAVGIAKGTFYHHFPSKDALLEALVDQMRSELPPQVLSVADDPDLGAIEKFVAFFERINAWKLTQAPIMVELGRAMVGPLGTQLRERSQQAALEVAVPILALIITQGMDEGVFQVEDAALSASIIMGILGSQGICLVAALYGTHHQPPSLEAMDRAIDAHSQAMERVLGAPVGSIQLFDRDITRQWFQAATAGMSADPSPRRSP